MGYFDSGFEWSGRWVTLIVGMSGRCYTEGGGLEGKSSSRALF